MTTEYNPKNPEVFKQVELPVPPPPQLNITPLGDGISTLREGDFQSKNFRSGRSGFRLRSDGTLEALNGVFAGNFEIGGTQVTIRSIDELSDAIDTVSSAGGGTVFLQPGTYTLTSDITVPSRVTLEGVARDSVIINCNSSYKVKMSGSNAYTTGTVTVSNGGTTVTGSGTTWTSSMVGQYIFLADYWYLISAVTDSTHLTITDAYFGEDLSGYGYAIADTAFNNTLRKLSVTGATGVAVEAAYCSEPWFDDLYVYDNGTGFDLDYVYAPRFFVSSFLNGVNGNFNYVGAFEIQFSAFAQSTTGAGLTMANCTSATILDSDFSGNTGNGIAFQSCGNIALVSTSINANGDNGIEFISGNNDIQVSHTEASDNTSDGFSFTATSDRVALVACSIKTNGAYGVNIAASTCDQNIITSCAFSGNTTAPVTDSGTGTVIKGCIGIKDSNSGATTKDISSSSTTVIAHGLGVAPRTTKLTGVVVSNATGITHASALYSNSTQVSQYWAIESGAGTQEEIGSSFRLYKNIGGADYIEASITVDSTNITITWSLTGSPTGTAQLLWEAYV